jgi:hypothetical protein
LPESRSAVAEVSGHTTCTLTLQAFTSDGSAISSGKRTKVTPSFDISANGLLTVDIDATLFVAKTQYVTLTVQVDGGSKVVDILASLTDHVTCLEVTPV